MDLGIGTVDIAVICIYLVGIVALGCWAGLHTRRDSAEAKTYFLAGGTLTWPVIGLALFSTNISTIHLVSLAQESYVNTFRKKFPQQLPSRSRPTPRVAEDGNKPLRCLS